MGLSHGRAHAVSARAGGDAPGQPGGGGAVSQPAARSAPTCPAAVTSNRSLRWPACCTTWGTDRSGIFSTSIILSQYGLTHETLGSEIIRRELGDLIRRVRRNPNGTLEPDETLDPEQIAFLITRPKTAKNSRRPGTRRRAGCGFCAACSAASTRSTTWISCCATPTCRATARGRSIWTGCCTTAFSAKGLTIHERGLAALVRFIGVRAELFRTIYFHRTVRAIDLELKDLFADSRAWLFPGNPLEHLDEYLHFTEWSLLIDVARWQQKRRSGTARSGPAVAGFLGSPRALENGLPADAGVRPGDAEQASIFSNVQFVEQAVRTVLPRILRELPLRIDLARHVHRPDTRGPAAGQNFLFDPVQGQPRPLTDDLLYRNLPLVQRICRIYAEDLVHAAEINRRAGRSARSRRQRRSDEHVAATIGAIVRSSHVLARRAPANSAQFNKYGKPRESILSCATGAPSMTFEGASRVVLGGEAGTQGVSDIRLYGQILLYISAFAVPLGDSNMLTRCIALTCALATGAAVVRAEEVKSFSDQRSCSLEAGSSSPRPTTCIGQSWSIPQPAKPAWPPRPTAAGILNLAPYFCWGPLKAVSRKPVV